MTDQEQIPQHVRDRLREIKNANVRIGHAVKMLTNGGYGLLGGSLGPPLISGDFKVLPQALFAAMVGGTLLLVSIWMAPYGKDATDD